MTDPATPPAPARRRRASAATEPGPAAPAASPPTSGDPWGLARPGEPVDAPLAPPPEPGPARLSRKAKAEADREADRVVGAAGIVQSASAARGEARAASPFGAMPQPGPGYDRITERIFDLPDPDAEYEELERALSLGTREHDSVFEALDRAQHNARRAHRLYVCARVDAERFNLDADVVEAAMRTQALHALEQDKLAGVRTKQITDADVGAKIAALFPDEHRDLAERRIKSRKMLEQLETFAKLWSSRCYSLASMLDSQR